MSKNNDSQITIMLNNISRDYNIPINDLVKYHDVDSNLSNKMRNESIIMLINANLTTNTMFKSLTFNHTIQVFDIRPFNIHQYLLKIERIFFNHHFTLLYNDSCSIPDAFEVFRHKNYETNYEPESLALLFY